MTDEIIFNLDGNSVIAEPGETIWEVAMEKKVIDQMVTAEHVWLKSTVSEH